MRLLAIDTALEACSVGVADGDRSLALYSEVIGRGHAERIMVIVEAAMRESGLAFADLDRFAVTVGPGSFTGVRVGIAAARGLALATGCPVVGISTLAALADKARVMAGARPVLAALDARRGEVYVQAFDEAGDALAPAVAISPAQFAAILPADVVLAGSGADLMRAVLATDAPVIHRDAAPDIAAVLRLGRAAPPPSGSPRPLYLRPPDAKPQAAFGVARR